MGSSTTVTADRVKSIKVQGAGNKVTYKSSPNKSTRAIVSIAGAANTVTKIK